MKERDHSNLEYEGGPGEAITLEIKNEGTTIPVTFKVDGGATQILGVSGSIRLAFKNSTGQRTDLQVITDGNAQGSHTFTLQNCSDCVNDVQHLGTCVRMRRVPPKKITLFAFFVA